MKKKKHIENKEKAQELFLRCYKHSGDLELSLAITGRKRRCFDTWRQKEPDFEYKYKAIVYSICDTAEKNIVKKINEGDIKCSIYYLEKHSVNYQPYSNKNPFIQQQLKQQQEIIPNHKITAEDIKEAIKDNKKEFVPRNQGF